MLETILISTIALVFIVEGFMPFLFPRIWQRIMAQIAHRSEREIRIMGFISIAIGLLILLFVSE